MELKKAYYLITPDDIIGEREEKKWLNPCIPYNIGFKESTGDIIIIQNPEIYHVGDCIKYVVDNLELGDWLTLNCYGSPNFKFNEDILQADSVYDLICENIKLKPTTFKQPPKKYKQIKCKY